MGQYTQVQATPCHSLDGLSAVGVLFNRHKGKTMHSECTESLPISASCTAMAVLLGGYAACSGNAHMPMGDSPLPSDHLRGQRSAAQCVPMIHQTPSLCLVSRGLHLYLKWSSLCLVGSIPLEVIGRLGHLVDNICSFQTDLYWVATDSFFYYVFRNTQNLVHTFKYCIFFLQFVHACMLTPCQIQG